MTCEARLVHPPGGKEIGPPPEFLEGCPPPLHFGSDVKLRLLVPAVHSGIVFGSEHWTRGSPLVLQGTPPEIRTKAFARAIWKDFKREAVGKSFLVLPGWLTLVCSDKNISAGIVFFRPESRL
jgi:hypothetical protein